MEFDRTEDEKLFDVWLALVYDEGEGREPLAGTLFSHATVARRKSA